MNPYGFMRNLYGNYVLAKKTQRKLYKDVNKALSARKHVNKEKN